MQISYFTRSIVHSLRSQSDRRIGFDKKKYLQLCSLIDWTNHSTFRFFFTLEVTWSSHTLVFFVSKVQVTSMFGCWTSLGKNGLGHYIGKKKVHMFDKQLIRGTAPWNRTTPTPEHLVTTTTQTNLFHAFELDRHGNIIGTLDRHGIWASLFRQVRWSRCFEVTQHAAELRGREVVSSSTKLIGRETKIVVPTKHQSTTTRKASQKECTCMYVRTPIKKE